MEQLLYSRSDVAKVLNVSTDTVDRLANTGVLRKHKIGAKTCYVKQDIQEFVDELMRKGAICLCR